MRLRLLILLLSTVTVAACARDQASGPEAARAEIEESVRSWVRALVDRDRTTMESLLAPDFRSTTYNGRVIDRETDIAAVTASEEFRFEKAEIKAIDVQVYGDAAVVRGEAVVTEWFKGNVATTPIRVTQTWIRRDGRWQAVAEQATRIE